MAYAYIYWGLKPSLTYAVPSPGSVGGVAPANSSGGTAAMTESLRVPKIIHQTWKSKDVPEQWRAAQASCRDLHPDYEYRLWTDA